MVRKLLKWIGYILLAFVLLLAIFAAFNWTLARNMAKIGGAKITQIDRFAPRETVRGCPAQPPATDAGLLPAATFAAMKRYSDGQGGVGLIVLIDGKIAGEDYAEGADAQTRTLSFSMHKTVVALAVGAAVQDGLIRSIDDPVGDYLSEWKDDQRGKITLRQLLTMSSGLHNYSMSKMEMGAFDMMMGDDVSKRALEAKLDDTPGSIFNYNNVNPQIAGIILSRVLQKAGRGRYADYLSQKIWCPLGNGDASLWLEREGGQPRYFAYLDSALRDWARVGLLIGGNGNFAGKQMLPAQWIAEMTKASAANPRYGLLTWRGSPWVKARRYSREVALTVPHKEAYLADDVVFLDGFGGQRVYIVPSAKLVIARSGETSVTWDDSVLVNTALRGIKTK